MTRLRGWPLGILLALVTLGSAAPASAEWFADLYGGAVIWVDPTLQVDVGGVSRERSKAGTVTDFTVGGRVGYWLDATLPWLGVAGDVSYYHLQGSPKHGGPTVLQTATFDVVPMTPLVMFRLPLLQSAEYPTGQLQPYIGAGPGFFWHERKLDFQSGERIRNETVDIGADVRAGVSWSFTPHWAVFGEYKFNYFSTSADRDITAGHVRAQSDIYTNSLLAGVRFIW